MSAKPLALVTGAAGFCGRHLLSHLLDSGYEVVGLDRQAQPDAGVEIYPADVTDAAAVQALLESIRPGLIFHLAALTNPRLDYQELHHVNALGTLALLRAVRHACPEAKVLVSSSSAVYGRVERVALPIGENQPFRPTSSYAASKVAQEMVAYQQFAAHGLCVIRTRGFNLTGPGESTSFVTSAFAQQIAKIEAGLGEPILNVGNLETVRDLTDVRDAVRGYRLLAEHGEAGAVYNVCSGQGTSIRHLLDKLLTLSHLRMISLRVDPARLQLADVPIQVGDATRIHGTTGWAPTIPIHQTLQDVLDSWRQRSAGSSEV